MSLYIAASVSGVVTLTSGSLTGIGMGLAGAGAGVAAAYGATKKPWKRIHFVSRGNLVSELDDFDIEIEAVETCSECGDEIEPTEIGAVVREDGEYKAVCTKTQCLDTV